MNSVQKLTQTDDPEHVHEFLTEGAELLDKMDNESNTESQDLLNRIFRAFHTLKNHSNSNDS